MPKWAVNLMLSLFGSLVVLLLTVIAWNVNKAYEKIDQIGTTMTAIELRVAEDRGTIYGRLQAVESRLDRIERSIP